jgi:hypothetical protein
MLLQLAHLIVVGGGVVIGDGDEIQVSARSRFDGAIDGAVSLPSALGRAAAVGIAGVDVEIAAIPARRGIDRGVCELDRARAGFDGDAGLVLDLGAGSDLRGAENQPPTSTPPSSPSP